MVFLGEQGVSSTPDDVSESARTSAGATAPIGVPCKQPCLLTGQTQRQPEDSSGDLPNDGGHQMAVPFWSRAPGGRDTGSLGLTGQGVAHQLNRVLRGRTR